MSAAVSLTDGDEQRRADLETLEEHAKKLAVAAEPARVALVELEVELAALDYPRRWIEHLVEPYRRAVDYADRVAAFVARARAGRVDPVVLARAADDVRSKR